MMQFFDQLMKLPLAAFVFSMEMFVKTMQGLQGIAYKGIDTMVGGVAQTSGGLPGSQSDLTNDVTNGAIGDSAEAMSQTAWGGGWRMSDRDWREGERRMSDRDWREGERRTSDKDWREGERRTSEKDLRDEDYLKLVRYKILFVKRDYEYAFPEKEELVSENTDAAGYTAWKIAEFIQDLPKTPIPEKWRSKKYPPVEVGSPPRDSTMIHALPEDDKKYLRVYYEVLDRYPRERFKYEERQIEVLEQIRDKMKDP
jgi:hypothetical protein